MFCIETSFKTISQSLHSWLGSTSHLRFHPSSHCPGTQDHKQLLNCQESSSRPLAGNHAQIARARACDCVWMYTCRAHRTQPQHSFQPCGILPCYSTLWKVKSVLQVSEITKVPTPAHSITNGFRNNISIWLRGSAPILSCLLTCEEKDCLCQSSGCKNKMWKLSFPVSSIWYFLKKTRLCSILQY